MSSHIVKKLGELAFAVPPEFVDHSAGYQGDLVVNEVDGAVQMGFQVSRLDGGGSVEAHVHSFEESVYVMSGELTVDLAEGSFLLAEGDYALFPLGATHALHNTSASECSFAEMKAPLPRARFEHDTFFTEPLPQNSVTPIDVRDPRTLSFGNIGPDAMNPKLQTQDRLALSASMRTALLVYSGISVKMMIDSDLGADLSTMFMVQYEPGGFAGAHDHPLEEAYLILEGDVEAVFDGSSYRLGPGDVAWAGVGCVHEFSNVGEGHVKWLETQAPQPPARHSYRFRRDWSYLATTLEDKGADNG